ncbi:hypothetical protein [uncultured Desulfobacter sp.]|uniref:hypothetical protein n=1 Tax=uncultured Desulfobacter sp. TaxID=240139 RepID=UPI002AAC32AC|nr:hypothetical protein [uncultured Desulfobacter sp.]
MKTGTNPIIRRELEDLTARHADHAGLLSSDVLKIAHGMIAVHWDAITSAILEGPLQVPKSRMQTAPRD